MSFRKFLTSKTFFYNIILAILFIVVLLWLTLHFLAKFTNHGEAFPTPNFYGLDSKDIGLMAAKKNVRYVVVDSVYHVSYTPGTVVEQNPQAGHYIKKGRKIYLTIASPNPKKTTVPKLTDVSLRQARVLIKSSGLVLNNVRFRPSRFDKLVLEQKISGKNASQGTLVPIGTNIDLVVGKIIGERRIKVPDLIGMKLDEAKRALQDVSLNVGTVNYDRTITGPEDMKNARIYEQSPSPETSKQISFGTHINLLLSIKEQETKPLKESITPHVQTE